VDVAFAGSVARVAHLVRAIGGCGHRPRAFAIDQEQRLCKSVELLKLCTECVEPRQLQFDIPL